MTPMTIAWLEQNKYQLVNFGHLSAYKIYIYLMNLGINELRNNQSAVSDERIYGSLRYFDDLISLYLHHRFGEFHIETKVENLTEEFDRHLSILIGSQNDH